MKSTVPWNTMSALNIYIILKTFFQNQRQTELITTLLVYLWANQ